jgi:predicted tellurium resistance membrane protein TerC
MDIIIPLVALTAMEIVLGIDNIVFIAILVGRLPESQRAKGRILGLGLALGARILLLFSLAWILGLDEPIFELHGLQGLLTSWGLAEMPEEVIQVSVRDLILLVGGLFLIGKSVHEIHVKLEDHGEQQKAVVHASFGSVLIQIALLDIIFSLDSVITAVGMVEKDKLWVMVVAIILAVIVMMIFSGKVSRFVDRHPTIKMLALSFLILIGVMLVAEGVGTSINKGYIYFAMFFSLVVELLNMKIRGRLRPASPVGATQN